MKKRKLNRPDEFRVTKGPEAESQSSHKSRVVGTDSSWKVTPAVPPPKLVSTDPSWVVKPAASAATVGSPPTSGTVKTVTCFLCGGGHFAKRCPRIQGETTSCALCGETNHRAKKCKKFKKSIQTGTNGGAVPERSEGLRAKKTAAKTDMDQHIPKKKRKLNRPDVVATDSSWKVTPAVPLPKLVSTDPSWVVKPAASAATVGSPPTNGTVKTVTCFLCGGAHYAKRCPRIQGETTSCALCGETNHRAKKCKKFKESIQTGTNGGAVPERSEGFKAKKTAAKTDMVCYCCGEKGHAKKDCPAKAERARLKAQEEQLKPQERSAFACFFCGEEGHIRRNCPQFAPVSCLTACYQCGEQGHTRFNCPQAEASGEWKACFHCGEPSHLIKDCPKKGEKVSWKDKKCPRCGEIGHGPFKCSTYVLQKVFHNLAKERQSLPIYSQRSKLLERIQAEDTILLEGETGCGKSTQLPQYIVEKGLNQDLCVAVTQPRRVAAITLAQRVAREKSVKVGKLVGYSVRFECNVSEETRIKYLTDGTLLREAISDPLLTKYSFIILDEAHERTLHTDVLFAVVKKAQKKRRKSLDLGSKPLKIIVMSATIDRSLLSGYFGQAMWFTLEGRQHPVEEMLADQKVSDYLKACQERFLQLHQDKPAEEGILMFLTGVEEIEKVSDTIQATIVRHLSKDKVPKLRICHFYSHMTDEQKDAVFQQAPEGTRKLILATNIAETSLTIPGVRHVIDCGMVKTKLYDPETDLEQLCVVQVSKAQAKQRCGRAGRQGPGSCWCMLTAKQYRKLPDHSLPEIKRTRLTSAVIQLLAMGVKDVLNFDFIEPPDRKALERALEELRLLGATDKHHQLTELGKKMALFPLDPRLSKVIVAADKYRCRDMMLTAAALLSVEDIFVFPEGQRDDARAIHNHYKVFESDVISMMNVYHEFIKSSDRQTFCKKTFVDYRNLKNARTIRKQLQAICSQHGLDTQSIRMDETIVRKALVEGFFLNAAKPVEGPTFETIIGKTPVTVHTTSFVYRKSPCVIFTSLLKTTKTFMRGLSAIHPDWLNDVAPKLFPRRLEPKSQQS